ncbi:hypothetical protein NQ317_002590 [Molorchus minor]|uniref:Uncharacterized protein n=1 Tax=Molorchus minor TaxID=1323400 RepID=A0ABQ9JSW9_9CUCU|nr:hypothetical protein NQ317_002590 [Molorchus minor]
MLFLFVLLWTKYNIGFLALLTSSVWVFSEIKKLIERYLERRCSGKQRTPLEYPQCVQIWILGVSKHADQ